MNKRKFFYFFIIIFNAFLLSSCMSNVEKVEKQLTESLALINNIEETEVTEIINALNAENTENDYTNLVKDMLKNMKYNILLVEEQDEKVVATVEFITKNIETLVEDFYKTIIIESTNKNLTGEEINKKELLNLSIKNMLESYQKNNLGENKKTIKLEFVKDENKNFNITNKAEYYDTMLGGLFAKLDAYSENELPRLRLESFLNALNKIKPEEIKVLLNAKDATGNLAIFEIYSKIYNNISYKIVSKVKKENETEFMVEIQMINAKKIFTDYATKFTTYYKKTIDDKKTPNNEELNLKSNEFFMQSIEENKENKITKEFEIILDETLNFKNMNEFISNIAIDINNASNEAKQQIQDGLK